MGMIFISTNTNAYQNHVCNSKEGTSQTTENQL